MTADWPANSLTQLSSPTLRNPTFTPDVADLYVMRLTATNASGQIAIRTLQFAAFDPVPPTIITQYIQNSTRTTGHSPSCAPANVTR